MARAYSHPLIKMYRFIAGEIVVINREGSNLHGLPAQIARHCEETERYAWVFVKGYCAPMLFDVGELVL
jgi:hypothetical protein